MSEARDGDLERRVARLEEQVAKHREALRAIADALPEVDRRLAPAKASTKARW